MTRADTPGHDGYRQTQPGQRPPALLYQSVRPPGDNHLVDLRAPQPALGRAALWKTCRALATCWALIGAAGCAYLFLSSTRAVTTLGDPFLWGPAWLQTIAVSGAIVLALPWLAVPAVLLIIGPIQLYRAGPARQLRLAGWVAATAAAATLEVMLVTGFGVRPVAPDYQGAALVSWVWLAEAASCVAIGTVMLAVLIRATEARSS